MIICLAQNKIFLKVFIAKLVSIANFNHRTINMNWITHLYISIMHFAAAKGWRT